VEEVEEELTGKDQVLLEDQEVQVVEDQEEQEVVQDLQITVHQVQSTLEEELVEEDGQHLVVEVVEVKEDQVLLL
jgi:hypothetical protein